MIFPIGPSLICHYTMDVGNDGLGICDSMVNVGNDGTCVGNRYICAYCKFGLEPVS